MDYDLEGRLHQVTDALGHATVYTYDTNGNQLSETRKQNGKPVTTTYAYDKSGRRTSTTMAASSSTITAYSPTGKVASTTDMARCHRDTLARARRQPGPYDAQGRRASSTDRGNRSNPAAGANGLTTTYNYDDAGRLGSYQYPNGVTTTMGYDSVNRVQSLTLAAAVALSSYGYTFYPTGNRKSVAESSGRNVTWNYDNLWRLQNETIAGSPTAGAISYGYDAVGNRLTRTSTVPGIAAQTNTYDANDRLTSDGWDAAGNTLASAGSQYGYDSENRLLSLNTNQAGYLYDGDGQLVARTVGGVTTTYLIDDQRPAEYAQIVEERVGGQVSKSYVFGLQRLSMRDAGGLHYYAYDAHSGVRALLDGNGVVTDTYEYDGFGNLIARTGTTANDFMYRGEQMDSALGLQYLRARWMSPAKGGFYTRDTEEGSSLDPISLHAYLYAGAGPVDAADPSGDDLLSTALLGQRVHKAIIAEFMKEPWNPDSRRLPDPSIDNTLVADKKTPIGQLRGGWLSPDMVGFNANGVGAEVYEIKPSSKTGRYRGVVQMWAYLGLLNKYGGPRVYVPGQSWTPPHRLYIDGKNIVIDGPYSGIIYYWVDDDGLVDDLIKLTVGIAVGASAGRTAAGQEAFGFGL